MIIEVFFYNVLIFIFQEYLMEGEIEEITHVVDIGILFTSKYLLEYDISMFPPSWRSLVNSLKK